MPEKLQELKMRLQEVFDLEMTGAVLSWDQQTYMPAGGAAARGRQLALLAQLGQEKFTDPAIGRLLEQLQPYTDSLPYDHDDAALLRVTRRKYEKETRVPPALVAEFNNHMAASYQAWSEARPANDFKKVIPFLEKTLDYSRKLANCFPGYEHIADPLIDYADYGMKASSVRAIFAELRQALVPIVQAITSQAAADDTCLRQGFAKQRQWDFGLEVIKELGYDFERGRQDLAPHPFTTKFSLGDVRITTRVDEKNFGDALFSTIHEAGHAMYEQGIKVKFEGTPLGRGTSSGVHESQSRLWENIVGRSRGFWKFFYPRLQSVFPAQLASVPLDTFYKAINKVEKTLIRTDADEVTYNLHVMLRFDFELELMEGTLAVKDLPEAWRERFKHDLGITPPDDRLGCLQDVHWFAGPLGGAFQGYTLGNLMSAVWYSQALKLHPEIPAEMEQGKFTTLHAWLRENIYQHGCKYTAAELVQRVTGAPLRIEPYIQYLKCKYGELYSL
ncbi:MAG TPA: carboxypeptidase M32 [Anaerolineaceae bacterium]